MFKVKLRAKNSDRPREFGTGVHGSNRKKFLVNYCNRGAIPIYRRGVGEQRAAKKKIHND